VNLTISYIPTPTEQRLRRRTRSYVGVAQYPAVALPVATVAVGLVIWRVRPGAASGWAVIAVMLAIGILAIPYLAAIRSMRTALHGREVPFQITIGDASLRWASDGYRSEAAWRNVTDIRAAAGCWIISLRAVPAALVLPRRAVPADELPEVTEFLSRWRDLAQDAPSEP